MKSFLKKLTALIIGLLLSLLIIEIFFRLAPLVFHKQDVKPDFQAYRILCVGDSSTYGLGASNKDKYSYPAQLNRILSQTNQKKIQVLNKGLPGINSSQTLKILKENIKKIAPDIILVCTGINDPWNYEESNIFRFYKTTSIFHKIKLKFKFYTSKLKIVRFIKLLIINLKQNKNIKEAAPDFNTKTINKNSEILPDQQKTSKALYETLKFNFIKMKQLAIKNNCQIYFLEYHAPGWSNPEKIINYLYKQLSLHVIQVQDTFQQLDNINSPIRSNDNWHPNNTGYLVLAKLICNSLAKNKQIRIPNYKLINKKTLEIRISK